MSAAVIDLPIWNPRVGPAERFEELARMAAADPKRFGKVIVIWNDEREADHSVDWTLVNVESSALAIGFMEVTKMAMVFGKDDT